MLKKARRPTIPIPEITKIQREWRSQNPFNLVETLTRNVILCGKARSGKTTAQKVLQNPTYQPATFSIFSETVRSVRSCFSIQDKRKTKSVGYTINMIDTPGFFEVKKDGTPRSNDVLFSSIFDCLEYEITKINAVLFFIDPGLGLFDSGSIQSLKMCLDTFGGHEGIDCGKSKASWSLVITRADRYLGDPSWTEVVLQKLSSHDFYKKFIKTKSIKKNNTDETVLVVDEENSFLNVLFMGCVDPRYRHSKEILYLDYQDIFYMRERMLDFIFNAEGTGMVNEMNIIRERQSKIPEIIKKCTSRFRHFQTVKDFETCETELLIVEHLKDMRILKSCSLSIEKYTDEVFEYIYEARKFARKSSIDLETRKRIIHGLSIKLSGEEEENDS